MFDVGEYVMSSTNGICKVSDRVQMDVSGEKKSYFLLIPTEEEHAKIYVPVENADKRIRKVLSRAQAMEVINHIGITKQLEITNEKEREKCYKEAIRSGDPLLLVEIIKNMYTRRQERMAEGKKITAVDERYFKIAVHHLHGELAFALGCDEEEVEQLICNQLEPAATE